MLNKNDPLVSAVQEVMKKNHIEREATKLVNEKFGVIDRRALPHEQQKNWDAAYQAVLSEGTDPAKYSDKQKRLAATAGDKSKIDAPDLAHVRKHGGKHIEEGEAPKTDPYAEKDAGHDVVTKVKEKSVTPSDQLALKKKIQGILKERKLNPYAVGMAAVKKSTGDEPPMEKKNITKAHEIAKSIMKKKAMNEHYSLESIQEEIAYNLLERAVFVYENYGEDHLVEFLSSLTEEQAEIFPLLESAGAPGGYVQAMQAKAKETAANNLQTQRMSAREPDAPKSSFLDRAVDTVKKTATDTYNAAKRGAASALTTAVGSDTSSKIQGFVKGTRPEDEKLQDAQKGISQKKGIVPDTINAVKRGAADLATKTLGPERSAQLQAAVKGTDVAKERSQEAEKSKIASVGQSQRFRPMPKPGASTSAAPASGPTSPMAGQGAPKPNAQAQFNALQKAKKPFEFTDAERKGKVSADRLKEYQKSNPGAKLGNFLNAAQNKTAVKGGRNDASAEQKALNTNIAMKKAGEAQRGRPMGAPTGTVNTTTPTSIGGARPGMVAKNSPTTPKQQSTNLQIGGARPGLVAKNSPTKRD